MRNKQCLRFTLKSMICMMALLLTFVFSSGSIVHAQQTQADLNLPVVQKFTVKNALHDAVNKKGSYELTALDAENPMPEGSTEGRHSFEINGNGQAELSMTYFHGGVYKYRICQTTPEADRYSYDRRIYTVTVYVENGQNGELTTQVIAENEKKEKCENISFENSYTGKDIPGTQTQGSPKPGSQNQGSQNPAGGGDQTRTGDNTPLAVWIAMLVIALSGIAAVFMLKRKAESEKDN